MSTSVTGTDRPATRPRPHRRLDVLRLVLGGVLLVLGVAVLSSPGTTLLVVGLLFGVQLLVAGLIRLALAIRSDARGGRRVLGLALAALTVVAGVVCVLQPGTSLVVLAVTVAVGWASDGVADLVRGTTGPLPATQRLWFVVLGVASVVSAVLLVVFPGTSLVVLAQLGGVLLLALGALTLLTALRPRR